MKYDDASWHYGGDFPKDLPNEAGATHIGMFVSWCMLNGLAGELHTKECPEDLALLKARELTPGAWFIKACDEKFIDEDLNEKGNSFAAYYYQAEDAEYIGDYSDALSDEIESLYHASDSWDLFNKLAPIIRKRYENWQTTHG